MYTATSLEDIAKMFDTQAKHARDAVARSRGSFCTFSSGAANAWEQAARILRETTLADLPRPSSGHTWAAAADIWESMKRYNGRPHLIHCGKPVEVV